MDYLFVIFVVAHIEKILDISIMTRKLVAAVKPFIRRNIKILS